MKSKFVHLIDRLGISLSVLCLLHCLVTPLLILIAPNIRPFEDVFYEHLIIGILAFIVLVFPLSESFKHNSRFYGHQKSKIKRFSFLSILFIGLALIAHDHMPEYLHIIFTVIGSLFLIMVHRSAHQSCKHN